jgi:starch-binding outer membrane protein, SusD/RagB family
MKKRPFNLLTILLVSFIIVSAACTKRSDLDQPRDSSLNVLNTAAEARALLDNIDVMRETPALAEISADNFYISDTETYDATELNAYLWKEDIFEGRKQIGDWNKPYQQVYYANAVLDALPRLSTSDKQQLDEIKGTALAFSKLYDEATAAEEWGIPLRLTADPTEVVGRATVAATYRQIIQDAKGSARWLPQTPDPLRKNRPSAPASYALLARVYLSMSDYRNAALYADSCLMLYTTLLNYNSLDAASGFTTNNGEVLYQSNLLSTANMFYPKKCFIDPDLYRSYASDDLRRQLFFSINNMGLPVPRYNYSGSIAMFSGLAVDEVLLIRAECNARMQNAAGALQDLTTLMQHRWKNGAYPPPVSSTAKEVLDQVLAERRKELVFRGTRLADIRRYNKQGAGISLQRRYKQTDYLLDAGSQKFVLPIPPDVIAVNDGIKQNPRSF